MLDPVLHERLKVAIKDITRESAKVVYVSTLTSVDRSRVEDVIPGQTLAELAKEADNHGLPVVCVLNDEYVLRCDWDVVPTPGDLIMFVTHPLGGDSGGGSNALRTILSIILVIVVAIYAPGLAASLGQSVGLVSAGLLIAGNLLINLLVPVKPAEQNGGNSGATASPTYSTNASGNQARLDGPIPVLYGRQLIYPDFAAQPYGEYDNATNDQYFNAVFCLGQGHYDVEAIMVDDTLVSHFTDVTLIPIPPGGLPVGSPSFPISIAVVNAIEVTGQTLGTWNTIGPFTSCGPGLRTSRIDIDMIMPNGLYYADNDGTLGPKSASWIVERRKLNDLGAPTAPWRLLGYESVTAADNTPIRRTYHYPIPSGRYEVRATRQDAVDPSARAGHVLTWAGMRSFIDTTSTLEPTATYYGLRMKATDQLNQLTQRKFAFILRRKLFTWNPTDGWSADPVYTRSPAWAIADALRDTVYGGRVPDERIDLQTLYDLSLLWADRRDYFDGVFDSTGTVWDSVGNIARAGRAVRYMRNGIFTFTRDSIQTVPRSLFNGRNIMKGSFKLNYITPTESTPDGIVLQYFSNVSWSYEYLTFPSPGVETPVSPQQVLLFGVTNRQQAIREALYTVAADRYRRRTISFSTEMDGFIPTYGDLIAVAYDLPQWGNGSGDVESYDDSTKTVYLSESIVFSDDSPHYIAFSTNEGAVDGPYLASPGADAYQVILSETPTETLYWGNDQERTRFSFGPSGNIYRLARVLSVSPKDINTVDITAVIEDDRVHTADGGSAGGEGGGVTDGGYRIAHYAPDGIPTYDSATGPQRDRYGFYAKDTGKVGTANDDGYHYDDS